MDSIAIIIGLVGLAIGFAIAKFMEKGKASKTIASAKKEAANIIKDANIEGENIKKDKILIRTRKFRNPKNEQGIRSLK